MGGLQAQGNWAEVMKLKSIGGALGYLHPVLHHPGYRGLHAGGYFASFEQFRALYAADQSEHRIAQLGSHRLTENRYSAGAFLPLVCTDRLLCVL